MNINDPKIMTDDDLLQELVELIRHSKTHGFHDRKRFRQVGAELKKRGFKFQ